MSLDENLIYGDKEACLSCFEETETQVACCKVSICKDCYYKWLQNKRQCMHCKVDQCDFETWVKDYRVEPEINPEDFELGDEYDDYIPDAQILLTQLVLHNLQNECAQQ